MKFSLKKFTNLKTSVDLYFLLFLFVYILYGQWVLSSASSIMAYHQKLNYFYYSDKQILWHLLGLLLMFITIYVPIHILKKYYKIILYIAIILLLMVFVPGIGKTVQDKNSFDFKRWIQIGFLSFQPSEFVKIAYLFYLPHLVKEKTFSFQEQWKDFIPFFFILLALFFQPQYGIMILFLAVFILFLILRGFSIIKLILILFLSMPFFIFITVLQPYRWERIKVWLDPYEFRFDKGYQLVMSFRAFSEGGLYGTDISRSIAHRYLTYGHTDFIFSLLAESSGIIGVLFLLVLILLIYIRGFQLIRQINDEFDFLLASGILLFFILQIVVNISVTTGLIPTTGIGLPFVSYGGSSLISYYILIGIFLNITKKRNFVNEA